MKEERKIATQKLNIYPIFVPIFFIYLPNLASEAQSRGIHKVTR